MAISDKLKSIAIIAFATTTLFALDTSYTSSQIQDIQTLSDAYMQRVNDAPLQCMGRLTLTSGTPITTSDVTGASANTIYFTPYHGNKISVYSGSRWLLMSFTEVSVAVPATTVTPFDIFAYNNSGTLTLETVNWTNDSTRATALTTQNGVYVKNGATTRRYLGTARTTSSSGQTEDSVSKRYLWNVCNRVKKDMRAYDTTDTWTYTTATWRQANGASANKVEFVLGLSEDLVTAISTTINKNTNNFYSATGVGIDSTSTNSSTLMGNWAVNSSVGTQHSSYYYGHPAVGYHYLAWLEISEAVGTSTWVGDAGLSYVQTGLFATGMF